MADSYAETILGTTGLLGYWRLGESSGTAAADSFGSNTGTYTGGYTLGTTGATIYPDKAVTLDGSSGRVPLGSVITPALITVEAWVRLGAGWSSTGIIASQYNNVGAWVQGFAFVVAADRRIAFGAQRATLGGDNFQVSGATLLSIGTTYHVAATFDGTTARVYLNGVSDGSAAAVFSTLSHSSPRQPNIGAADFGAIGALFKGVLDEVAVYNRALTAAEVLAHYNAGIGNFGSLLLRRRRCA